MQVSIFNHQIEISKNLTIVGKNGSGKSKQLRKLRDELTSLDTLYIEGGRKIDITSHNLLNSFGNQSSQEKEQNYQASKKIGINGRLQSRISLLYKKSMDDSIAQIHKLKIESKNGVTHGPVTLIRTKLDELFDTFKNIFPDLTLVINPPDDSIMVEKDGVRYNTGSLSDGEKQCMALCVDLLILDKSPDIIFVDEPEINLHPDLSVKLWNEIESKIDSIFIYATHSVHFCMRTGTEVIFGLNSETGKIIDQGDILGSDVISEIMGSLPGILNSNYVLFTEGHPNKDTDKNFYKWLLKGNEIFVIPVQEKSSVIKLVKKSEAIMDLSPALVIVGVVDSDLEENDVNLKATA